MTVRPGATTSTFFENRASLGFAALFRICQAMTIAMTTVLPEPVAILEQRRSKGPPSDGTVRAYPAGVGALREPYQRLCGLELAEEEAPGVELLRVRPVVEQTLGHARDAGVSGFLPRPHPLSNLVDERDLDEHARVVEHPGVPRRHQVPRGAAAALPVELPQLTVVLPVQLRLGVRGVDDEAVYGCLGHWPISA